MQERNPLTPFGKEVKHRLIDLGKTNGWLVSEVKERSGSEKFDTSFMSKILNGKVKNSSYSDLIRTILHEEENRQGVSYEP